MERFYRPAGSAGDGCGLGLAIVQEIAKLHCGHIEIGTPDRDTGTLLHVTFSQRAPAQGPTTSWPRAPRLARMSRLSYAAACRKGDERLASGGGSLPQKAVEKLAQTLPTYR